MEPSDHLAVVVLAAGRGRRFGATKQLAELDGVAMVRRVVDVASRAAVGAVVVVVGHDADAVVAVLPGEVRVEHNPAYGEGQATSLGAGLAAAEELGVDAVVVLLADEPGVTVDAVRRVAAAPAAVARARWDDGVGHPVRLHRSVWPVLAGHEGDVGARGLLGGAVEVRVEGPRPRDVDTRDDLASLDGTATVRSSPTTETP